MSQTDKQKSADATENLNQFGNSVEDWFSCLMDYNTRLSNTLSDKLTEPADLHSSLFFEIADASREFFEQASSQPAGVIAETVSLWQNQLKLWQNAMLRLAGRDVEPMVHTEKGDNRFKDPEWDSNVFFNYIKESYLLSVKPILRSIKNLQGLDDKSRTRLEFFVRQIINAYAPSNFIMTNPEVLRQTAETGGMNLLKGFEQWLYDLEKSTQALNVSMTDITAFELGENIATTPGKVVFRNKLIELIQYAPTTDKVYKTPLLILPPWVNKYYVLDLRANNSLVQWALDQGHTVFMVSWVNPDNSYRDYNFDEYIEQGVYAAIDAIESATGEKQVNAAGYCLGGVLLATSLAHMAKTGQQRIKSATLMATLLDYSDPGDIGAFVDEKTVQAIELENQRQGYFDGRALSVAFSLLRENDLYWNYFVQNYLKGERPMPFDLLYWNSDCTNLPAAMHSFIMRKLYLKNELIQPNAITVAGQAIDLSQVKTPGFFMATLQDHITKWKGCYSSACHYGGPSKFVLGESGHVAGIMNPPRRGKYGHYVCDEPIELLSPETWFEKSQKVEGSWWPTWQAWIDQYAGPKVAARQPGQGQLQALDDAPGRYVKSRVVDFNAEEFKQTLSELMKRSQSQVA